MNYSRPTTDASKGKPALLPKGILFPFVLVTSLFALWGFADDVTNPLVNAFKDVFVIVGGALMPPLQGRIIDAGGESESGVLMGLPAVTVSFVLPLACFVFIAFHGWRTFRIDHATSPSETITTDHWELDLPK